ncbi:hypothetical protein [Lysobacter gummosus]
MTRVSPGACSARESACPGRALPPRARRSHRAAVARVGQSAGEI